MLKPTPTDTGIYLIPPKVVPNFWGMVEDQIIAACTHTPCEVTPETLLNECFTGNSQLWIVWSSERGCEASVVTGIVPFLATCFIKVCAGKNMENWLGLLDEIEKWAKAQGCVRMRLFGRQGWRRVLKDYHVTRIIMDKEL